MGNNNKVNDVATITLHELAADLQGFTGIPLANAKHCISNICKGIDESMGVGKNVRIMQVGILGNYKLEGEQYKGTIRKWPNAKQRANTLSHVELVSMVRKDMPLGNVTDDSYSDIWRAFCEVLNTRLRKGYAVYVAGSGVLAYNKGKKEFIWHISPLLSGKLSMLRLAV